MTAIRVFVNATPVDIDPGATALECVRRWRPDEADAVMAGQRVITDSRGLPVAGTAIAHAGSIYRTMPNRATARDG